MIDYSSNHTSYSSATMLSFTLSFFSVVVLLTTSTTAQPYKATEHFLLDCGSSSSTTASDSIWDGDQNSISVPSNINTTSFSSTPDYTDSSMPLNPPFTCARIFNASSFTYNFPVSEGPKFLRLYFYPATYSDLKPDLSYFSVSSNGFSLLTNFSPFLTASYLATTQSDGGVRVPNFVKEFIIYVKDTQILNVAFTPAPNSYAFINGIEIVFGNTPVYDQHEPITYTTDTPNYTAPELVYRTQRSLGNQSEMYNLTWILPVDSGYYYNLRLHFCNIIPQYTKKGQVVFQIFINNQTADEEIDLFYLTKGSGYPVFKDYVVYVDDPHHSRGKQDLWVVLHPNPASKLYLDAYLSGLEAFKLSKDGSLASPNPELSSTPLPTGQNTTGRRKKKKPPYALITGGIGGVSVLLLFIVLVLHKRRRVKHHGAAKDEAVYGQAYSESKPSHSTLPSSRCRRFSLTEMRAATNEFNENFVIGNGGFGNVYKGYIDNAATIVAIKRLNKSSNQGFQEFHTEIGMLSKLRHGQLVSLIGYCEDEGEMILVYDYMAHGTLREHLYKTNKPPLPWKRRLEICIGAAKGLHYLHTCAKRAIIHRDVKSTNILLDENWVAKVSDFGLSKLGPRDEAQTHVSTVVKGSVGYVDPEYYRNQQLTEKSDVYSFGVVLLEVLCARPVIIQGLPDEQVSLTEWGKSCYQTGTLNKIIDPKLSVIAFDCLRQFGDLAISCLKEQGSERPAMDEVVWGLEFALELQEAYEKTLGKAMSEKQEPTFMLQEETTTDNEVLSRSSTLRNATSSISSSNEGFKSETVFSEILKPTGR